MVVAAGRNKNRTMGGSSFGGKGLTWIAYLFSTVALAVLAFNMVLPTYVSPANMMQNNDAAIRGGRAIGEQYPFKVAICVLMELL